MAEPLTLHEVAGLAQVFDAVNGEADVQGALSQLPASFRNPTLESWVSGTAQVPFHFSAQSRGMQFIFLNGTSSLEQAANITLGYSLGNSLQGWPQANAAYASYAETILAWWNSLPSRFAIYTYIFGHSLGGACAHLVGRKLARMGLHKVSIEVVTIGCPKWTTNWQEPNDVAGLIERPFAMSVDIVPQLPPRLLQTPVLYALLPLPVIARMQAFWQPALPFGLTPQGEASSLLDNPWTPLLQPSGIGDLYRDVNAKFDSIHGSGPYYRALRAYANRYDSSNSPPIPQTPQEPIPHRQSASEEAAILGVSVARLHSNYMPQNANLLAEHKTGYRAMRRGGKYYVRRGDVVLGQVAKKPIAKRIAKAARSIAKTESISLPEDLAVLDTRITEVYRDKFITTFV